jgi:HEAT repeat protein
LADPAVTRAALEALGRLTVPEAVEILVEMTATPKWRESCMASLLRLAEQQGPAVARGLAHENPNVRRAVVEVLTRANPDQVAELLAPALGDPDGSVRSAALTGLARMGMRGTAPAPARGGA